MSSKDFAKAVMDLCYLFHINNGGAACVRRHTYVYGHTYVYVCVAIHMFGECSNRRKRLCFSLFGNAQQLCGNLHT